MESQLLPISPSKTQEHSDWAEKLIREWLFRFGVEHKEDVAPKLPLWLEEFGKMDADTLQRLFARALRTCKFFPKVSEILEPLVSAEKKLRQKPQRKPGRLSWRFAASTGIPTYPARSIGP